MNSNNNTKSNFGKWGWSMIIYCAISYYLAAALSTDALNWFPAAFQAYHGWGEEFVNTCNAMAGIGGWIGVGAAIVFSMMTAKKGSRFMALFGNIVTGILCLIMAFTGSQPIFYLMIICLTFVGRQHPAERGTKQHHECMVPEEKRSCAGMGFHGSADLHRYHYSDLQCHR